MQRRSVLAAAGLLAGARWFTPSVSAHQGGESWESFQSDRQNTGRATAASGPTTNVGTAWRYGTRGGITGGAIIANGRAYIPSQDGSLTAVSIEDGSELWTATIDEPIDTTPALLDGQIYVGSRSATLYEIQDDGTVANEHSLTDSDTQATLSGICTNEEALYALVGEYDSVDGWSDGKLTAIDPAMGVEIWSESLISSVPHTPAIDDGTVYCYGIGAQDGATGSVLALNTSDGELEWSGGGSYGPGGLTVAGESVIATAGGTVTAIGQSTGSTQWEFETSEDSQWANSSAAIADRNIYVTVEDGDEFGYLYDIDLVSGEANGRVEFYNPVAASPVVTDDHVYVTTEGGRLYAINRADLSTEWTIKFGDAVRAPPAIVGDQLVTGTTAGHAVLVRDNAQTPTPTINPTATPSSTEPTTSTQTAQTTERDQSTTPTPEESARSGSSTTTPSRGFFTNSGDSPLSFLNDPFLLTVAGFMLSVIGILQQLLGGD